MVENGVTTWEKLVSLKLALSLAEGSADPFIEQYNKLTNFWCG